jgi:hypothetical protein
MVKNVLRSFYSFLYGERSSVGAFAESITLATQRFVRLEVCNRKFDIMSSVWNTVLVLGEFVCYCMTKSCHAFLTSYAST